MRDAGIFDGVELLQADGTPPTVLAAGHAPGETGVSVMGMRFRGGAHFRATRAAAYGLLSGPAPARSNPGSR